MKLASVIIDGKPSFGAVTARGYIDLRPYFGDRCADLRQLLASGRVKEIENILPTAAALPLTAISFDRVIPNLDARMFGLGWSYMDHQIETGKEPPEHPFLFNKLPQAMVGSGQPLHKPRISERFDYEGEIVVVIGKSGRHIPPEQASEYIAGYSIMMDGSIRDWQQHSVTAGKNFDRSSSYGPWMVTKDEIPDPTQVELVTRINGTVMQRSLFSLMAWRVEELISYISTFCRLEVGDSISTGTPGGVGHKRNPPVFLKVGDNISIEVSGIGVLTNNVCEDIDYEVR